MQLDYDPNLVSYEQLIDAFFRSHDATARGRGRQYQSVIFYHSPEQEEMARQAIHKRHGVATTVESFNSFWVAEAYHQKWLLQRKRELFLSLGLETPDELVTSPAASLLNAFAARRLTMDSLEARFQDLVSTGDMEQDVLDAVIAAARAMTDDPIVMYG